MPPTKRRPIPMREMLKSIATAQATADTVERPAGSYLPLAGGTISGNLLIEGDLELQGSVGIGREAPQDGPRLWLLKGDSTDDPPEWEDEDVAVLEGDPERNAVLSILSAPDKRGGVAFSSSKGRVRGGLSYDHGDDALRLFTENVRRLLLDAECARFEQSIDIPISTVLILDPPSGYVRIYFAADGLHLRQSDGTDTLILEL